METLIETNRHLLQTGRAREPEPREGVTILPPVRVAADVVLENVTLGPNVSVEAGCDIRDSTVRDSILGGNVRLRGCTLHGSMIGDHSSAEGITGRLNVGDHSEVRVDS